MKNRLNIIQINGIKGIIFLIGVAMCLVAGFIGFPSIVMKLGWNCISQLTGFLPQISTVQGLLLWGIVVLSYFTFKKKGFFVEFKSAHELSGEEMDSVIRRIRDDRRSDIITKSILRARELEIDSKTALDKFESGLDIKSLDELSTDSVEGHDPVENSKN